MGRVNRWLVLALTTGVGVFADWGTKALVLRDIEPDSLHPVLGDVLQWTLVYNPGAAFSMDPGRWIPGFPTNAFYLGVSIVGIIVLTAVWARLDAATNRLTRLGLATILPGAIGNFIDRVVGRPGVVDFIRVDLGFPPVDPWPILNVADIFVTVGVGLVFLDLLLGEFRQWRAKGRA
jgi:signal peptidase II